MSKYIGTTELISGLIQAGGNNFPLVHASAVQVDDDGKRLDSALEEANIKVYPITEVVGAVLMPDKYYVFGTVDSVDVILDNVDDGYAHEYCFEFTASESFSEMNITPAPKWANDLFIEKNKTYQVSILRGIGVIIGA
jgi:hypothetical protein